MRVRLTFEEIRHTAGKRVVCSVCGKSITRQRTFTATLNPWNLGPTGEPATYDEAMAKLMAKGRDWMSVPEQHAACVVRS